MFTKETFYFPSNAPQQQIYAVRYIPQGEIKAVLQISHGMVEFVERYENFAAYLTNLGFLVVGNDHLGHGYSVSSKDDYGYFAKDNGNDMVLEDLHTLTQITKKQYPNLPYFLLGHSMGSFYARQYLCKYGNELTGAIIMGTGHQAPVLVKSGLFLTKIIAKFKGWHHRSNFINNIAFGSYNKKFEPARTSKDWLTKDNAIVDRYLAEERSQFIFTLNGYYNMFYGINLLHDQTFLNQMPKDLPVFFVSGSDDPVGEFTKGVTKAIKTFEIAGMKHISHKFYPKDRHEILNETDREVVYQDLAQWLLSLI